jgi:hypothetical protein
MYRRLHTRKEVIIASYRVNQDSPKLVFDATIVNIDDAILVTRLRNEVLGEDSHGARCMVPSSVATTEGSIVNRTEDMNKERFLPPLPLVGSGSAFFATKTLLP